MSWKPAMLVDGVWSYNALRFAERWEAEASARELFSRWTMPTDHAAHPSDDPVNYHWDSEAHRAVAGEMPAAMREARARAIVEAIHAIPDSPLAHWYASYVDSITEPPFVVPWEREARVQDLPAHVRTALARVGYAAPTVKITVAHRKIVVSSHANDGQRVTIATCERESPIVAGAFRVTTEAGPYGGPNMFTPVPAIDKRPVREIPDGGCIVVAHSTHKRKSPWVTLHARAIDALAWLAPDSADLAVARDAHAEGRWQDADTIARQGLAAIAAPAIDPSDAEVLLVFRGYKSAARPTALARIFDGDAGAARASVDSLVARGMLKRASNGATSLAPEGKNAIAHLRSFGDM